MSEISQYPDEVTKYLKKYGAEKRHCEIPPGKVFDNIIVIPALQEYENIKPLLLSLLQNDGEYFNVTLILFVVNNLESASREIKKENKLTLEFLSSLSTSDYMGEDELILYVRQTGLNVGFIDASTEGNGLPENDGGVGLARKTGMDEALKHFDYSSPGKKLLICLDADCTVEENYIAEIVKYFRTGNSNAGYVEFEHRLPDDEEHRKAIISYEIFLRYYVAGLQYAGSPFAIHTIGSTMICDHESYIKIGGMNKKKAAEDFYFMEKLAKICDVKKITGTKVYPSARGSWRVPFGTGQRINRYFAGTHNEYELYDPQCFEILKNWLLIFNNEKILSSDSYLDEAEKIHKGLREFLSLNSFGDSWDKIQANSKSQVQLRRQKNFWFDGFRTLKLIHYLRDNHFPPVNMFSALDIFLRNYAFSVDREGSGNVPGSAIQLKYLNILRKIA